MPREILSLRRVAAELGLTQKALDILLASHSDLWPRVGLLADLLLQTGQIAECRTLLDRANCGSSECFGRVQPPPPAEPRRYSLALPEFPPTTGSTCQCAPRGSTNAQAVIDKLCGRLDASERRTAPTLAPVRRRCWPARRD